MKADGTDQSRLSNNPAEDDFRACSPDGSKIAFVSNRDGNKEIYVMNAGGMGQTNVTKNPAEDGTPACSPDEPKMGFFWVRRPDI